MTTTITCKCGTTYELGQDDLYLDDEDTCPKCNPNRKKPGRKLVASLRDVNGKRKDRQQDYFVMGSDGRLLVNDLRL